MRKITPELIDLTKYKRQFIAGINTKGEKIIWANCFCSGDVNEFKYWRRDIVFVMDGGNCFFNLSINLVTKISFQLQVNGIG